MTPHPTLVLFYLAYRRGRGRWWGHLRDPTHSPEPSPHHRPQNQEVVWLGVAGPAGPKGGWRVGQLGDVVQSCSF